MSKNDGTPERDRNMSKGVKRSLEQDVSSGQRPSKMASQSPIPGSSTSRESSDKQKNHERDESVLSRRQKQIDFGKNTLAYDRYRSSVPKNKRAKDDPKTPPKHFQMTRRAFDGLVKNWKIKLHRWNEQNPTDTDDTS